MRRFAICIYITTKQNHRNAKCQQALQTTHPILWLTSSQRCFNLHLQEHAVPMQMSSRIRWLNMPAGQQLYLSTSRELLECSVWVSMPLSRIWSWSWLECGMLPELLHWLLSIPSKSISCMECAAFSTQRSAPCSNQCKLVQSIKLL